MHGNLYRGGQINPEEVDQYYAGKTVTARAFLSTSADPDTAKRFARNAVFQIETEGAPLIDWLSVHPNEGEILLPPGTRLNVVDVIVTEKNGKPFYNVKLRHVTSSLATKRLSISFPALASWNGSYQGTEIGTVTKRIRALLRPGSYDGFALDKPCIFDVASTSADKVDLSLTIEGR